MRYWTKYSLLWKYTKVIMVIISVNFPIWNHHYLTVKFTCNSGCQVYPANTKHLYNICTLLDQRRRRWGDVVKLLYKYFVFAGYGVIPIEKFHPENNLGKFFKGHPIRTVKLLYHFTAFYYQEILSDLSCELLSTLFITYSKFYDAN